MPPDSIVSAGLPLVIAGTFPIDDDAVHAEGERHLFAPLGDLRAAGGDPVEVRPQRFVAVTAVQVHDMRSAFDHLSRDDVRDPLGERAVCLAGEHAIQVLVVCR